MSDFQMFHSKPDSFYDRFERKGELQHQTHYCPGCGHGNAHKLIAEAIDLLGIKDRTVLVSPVGCSVFAYNYFDVGNVQVAHGRAPAAATALKRALPHSVVISYQGDGDLAAIGTAEILHAANRGEPITVFFVNNAIYGMTGGQMAPTTPLGAKSTTSPSGRNPWNEGYPLHVSEVLASLEAPVFIERVALGNNKMIQQAAKAIRKALDNQVKGLGFSLVEILSPCPTIWKMEPEQAQTWIREELTKVYPLGNFRDRTKDAQSRPAPAASPTLEELPKLLNLKKDRPAPPVNTLKRCSKIKVAGFGGQGVLTLGYVLAETALDSGLHVSWLPSYGPEMRSGTSNCHVRISSDEIDSPLVTSPDILMAFNEPSLHKFVASVEPGGWILYNGRALPPGISRTDVNWIIQPFSELGDQAGDTRAGNIAMLGALLEATNILDEARVMTALERIVKTPRWLEIDRKALAAGRAAFLEQGVCV